MKAKQLLLALFALLMTATAWADVEINATNFPDAVNILNLMAEQ